MKDPVKRSAILKMVLILTLIVAAILLFLSLIFDKDLF